MPPELTREAFSRLTAWLHPDPARAGEHYERLRRTLVDFFRWRDDWSPEDLADDVLNRIASQLERGTEIRYSRAYACEVARRVHLEQRQRPDRRTVPLDTQPDPEAHDGDPYSVIERDRAERDLARRCAYAQRCLDALPQDSRALFLAYHHGQGRRRIDARRALAARHGLSMNALRIRVCRIADALSACVDAWLQGESAG
jgi:DNA-directed RNA polymerase specialized sigma24 family protein